MFTMRKSIIKNVTHFIGDFVNDFLFGDFVFLFALQSCSVTFSQRILYFVTSSDDVFCDLMLQVW